MYGLQRRGPLFISLAHNVGHTNIYIFFSLKNIRKNNWLLNFAEHFNDGSCDANGWPIGYQSMMMIFLLGLFACWVSMYSILVLVFSVTSLANYTVIRFLWLVKTLMEQLQQLLSIYLCILFRIQNMCIAQWHHYSLFSKKIVFTCARSHDLPLKISARRIFRGYNRGV